MRKILCVLIIPGIVNGKAHVSISAKGGFVLVQECKKLLENKKVEDGRQVE